MSRTITCPSPENPFEGLYQDAEGTIPVTAVGQRVGRCVQPFGTVFVQPTQTQPVAREPLTDEQIKDLQDDGVFLGSCRQIVRAIEAAHGIKGGQHGTE